MATGPVDDEPRDRRGRRVRLGCGVVAVSAGVGVVVFFAVDLLTPCGGSPHGCEDGDPDAEAMQALTAAFAGAAAFVACLIVLGLLVLLGVSWRSRPDEPEWP